jgi:hypothetical protein
MAYYCLISSYLAFVSYAVDLKDLRTERVRIQILSTQTRIDSQGPCFPPLTFQLLSSSPSYSVLRTCPQAGKLPYGAADYIHTQFQEAGLRPGARNIENRQTQLVDALCEIQYICWGAIWVIENPDRVSGSDGGGSEQTVPAADCTGTECPQDEFFVL